MDVESKLKKVDIWKVMFGKHTTKEDLQDLEKRAVIGETISAMISSRTWDILEENILYPMEEKAFSEFQKVLPSEKDEIIQTQAVGKVIEEIRRVAMSLVEEGRQCRQELTELNK